MTFSQEYNRRAVAAQDPFIRPFFPFPRGQKAQTRTGTLDPVHLSGFVIEYRRRENSHGENKMKMKNRECGIAALTVAVAMSFGKQGFGQTPDLSRAFSGETAAIAKPAAALQARMRENVAVSQAAFMEKSAASLTPFDTLKGYYADGETPRRALVSGVSKGLCFHARTPNTPEEAYLVGGNFPNEGEPDDGPLLTPFKVGILSGYDPMSVADLMSFINAATDRAGSLASINQDVEYRIRVPRSVSVNRYLIASIVATKNAPALGLKAGQISGMCYFFDKIHD